MVIFFCGRRLQIPNDVWGQGQGYDRSHRIGAIRSPAQIADAGQSRALAAQKIFQLLGQFHGFIVRIPQNRKILWESFLYKSARIAPSFLFIL